MQLEFTNKFWNHHLAWLLLGIAVPALAAMLVVIDGEKISFFFLPEFPLPTICSARLLFDMGCPGCGLTRSIVYLVQGDFAKSLAIHRFGWLIFTGIVIQIPLRIWTLSGRELRFFSGSKSKALLGISFAVLLLFNWFLNLISLF